MKKYSVYLSDFETEPLYVDCINKTEARAKANAYIKAWKLKGWDGLRAKIVKIEEDK